MSCIITHPLSPFQISRFFLCKGSFLERNADIDVRLGQKGWKGYPEKTARSFAAIYGMRITLKDI